MPQQAKGKGDVQGVCRDALLHLADISDDWLPVLKESVTSVGEGKMTDGFRLIVPKVCNQLMSALDYIATWAQSVCSGKPAGKPYFFFAGAGDSKSQISKKMRQIFPGLHAAFSDVHRFLEESQALLSQKDSVLRELRALNAVMKHRRLLEAGTIHGAAGVTIINWSSQADRPPMWVWAEAIHMSPDSSIAGGPGSLIAATDKITFDNDSRIFGFSGTDIHSTNTSPDVDVLDFVPLWHVPGLTMPILQFLGMAVDSVARIVRQFVATHGFWEQLWPEQRIAHFGQTRCGGAITLSPGRIEANWHRDWKAPSVSWITWGEGAEPIRD